MTEWNIQSLLGVNTWITKEQSHRGENTALLQLVQALPPPTKPHVRSTSDVIRRWTATQRACSEEGKKEERLAGTYDAVGMKMAQIPC